MPLDLADRRLDKVFQLGAKPRIVGLGPEALQLEVFSHPVDRVPLLPRIELLLRAVPRGIVAGRVRAHPVRHRLDHGWAAAGPGLVDRGLRPCVHREDVVPVHADAFESVRQRLLCKRLCRGLTGDGDRDRELVVLAEKDRRGLEHPREVHRGMEVALARRTVAEVGHRDDVVLPDLRGPGGADRLGNLGADWAGHGYEMDVLGSVVARHLSTPLRVFRVPVRLGDDGLEREAPNKGTARLAVRGEDPVPFLEGHRAADLARFLALARHVEADATLALKGKHPVVEDADHDEVAVRLLQGRGRQLRLPLRIVGAVELDDSEKLLFGCPLTPPEPVSASGLLSPKRIHRPDTKSARADTRRLYRNPSTRQTLDDT